MNAIQTCKAKNCDNAVKWKGFCRAHYNRVLRNGTIEIIAFRWDLESVHKAASKCATRKEFMKKHRGAWQWARNRNLLDYVCSHMRPPPNIIRCVNELMKYDSFAAFNTFSHADYKWALRHNITELLKESIKGK